MKNNLTLLVGLLMTSSLMAQVTEKTRTMSLGTQNALILSIDGADDKLIIKMWDDYMDEYGKTKKNRKTDEYFTDDVKVASISGAGTMDVYATSEDGQLITFFDMGNGFLSEESHKEAYKGAVLFLTEFGYEVKRAMIREEMEDEAKNLSKMERDLNGLEKDNDRYHKTIEKAKQDIAQAEADIAQNLTDQENAKKQIESQKQVIEKVKERLENVGK